MDAGVGFLLARFVLNLSVLYMDCIKRVHRNLPKLWTSSRNLKTQRAIIARIQQHRDSNNRANQTDYCTFHVGFW